MWNKYLVGITPKLYERDNKNQHKDDADIVQNCCYIFVSNTLVLRL